MLNHTRLLFLVAVFFSLATPVFPGAAPALAQAVTQLSFAAPRNAPYPGGVAIVRVNKPDGPQVRDVVYLGKRVITVNADEGSFAIVGIPLDAKPGPQRVQVGAGKDGVEIVYETSFDVDAKTYPTQHLKIDPRFITPSPAQQKRIDEESPRIQAAQDYWSDTRPDSFVLDVPTAGRLSATFGQGRVLNGVPSVPHMGVDVAVGPGTPVRASAKGRVINTDNYFYAGNSVFVDHGQGFITLYIHLSRIDVKEGDEVARGAVLGLSGATGRVTGPHLHWGVLLNGAYVAPDLFMNGAR